MKVKELEPRSAITAAPSESLRAAAERLTEDEIGALVVYGTIGPIGIFSERDLAHALADDADPNETQIKDYMTRAPISIDETEDVVSAVRQMNEYGVRHLLVKRGDEVLGVISSRDIMDWFIQPVSVP